ncbi:MAG: tetratricopeptide repeat protein [Bacteroidales bacterium]|nr:tetratricopeptide repeat protein [Bacteroidales bacterium]
MIKLSKWFIIFTLSFLLEITSLYSQKTVVYYDIDLQFRNGLSLYEKEKYAAAQSLFREVITYYGSNHTQVRSDAEFFNAICAIRLFNPDAEFLLQNFLLNYPESSKATLAYFEMGKFKYKDGKYDEALVWFSKLKKSDIGNTDDKIEYTFKTGYCYFHKGDYSKAYTNFQEVKNTNSKYKTPALYYFSHVAYIQKKYETALVGFDSLSNDPKFAPIVPYYKTHIYFYQKRYDEIIEYAPKHIDKVAPQRKSEILRVIAEAYFKKQQYDKALPYFEDYFKTSQSFTKDDYYELGYIYYRNGKYEKAVEYLNKVTGENDTIAQNAYYHLADCYIKTKKREEAKNAFNAALKYDVSAEIKEDATYNYAKLAFELSYSPFNEAIKALLDYINSYPNSKRIDEAYSYLVKVFMSARNYKDALASLEKIKKKNAEMNMAYQRIAYFRGLELFNNLEFDESIAMFDKSLKFSIYDKNMTAMTYYWKGEAFYRINNYKASQANFDTFLLSPGAINTSHYDLTHYNLAYAYFKNEEYEEAANWFRKYTELTKNKKSKIIADAYNRIGDSYFMVRKYDQAVKYYKMAVDLGVMDPDYAQFQIGFCNGLLKNLDAKVTDLQTLISKYPSSSYIDDAYYEIARTYLRKELYDMAVQNFEKIINQYPKSSYVKKSLSDIGLIYFNEGKNEKAIAAYKKIITEYPGTQEARQALTQLENIYVSQGDVKTYLAYIQELGSFANISLSKQDSLLYLSAEDAYVRGDCAKAITLFDDYIKKFEDGIFSLNAQFYKGDCHYNTSEFPQALKAFEFIIGKNRNNFSEQSLINAALIAYKLELYEKSLAYYSELEITAEVKSNLLIAREGQLECCIKLKDYNKTLDVAKKLIITEKVSGEAIRKANFLMAEAYLKLNDIPNALIKYRTVALDLSSKEGSESKYKVSEILFNQNNLVDSEKEILDFMDANSPHQYWLAKSYLLWGSIFEAKNDLFQAKITYQGVIENYKVTDDGIVLLAAEKLQSVEEKENGAKKEQEPVNIDLGN